MPRTRTTERIRIGVSTCLLGENVRFDGGHKRDPFLTRVLSRYFEFVPVCPEVELGLGVPRPTLRLIEGDDAPRMVTSDGERDISTSMRDYARERVARLTGEDLSGYVLKAGSPSCGMERVRVYSEKGMPTKKGIGLFARELMARFTLLPIEEEGRLHDPVLRENFVERVFGFHRMTTLLGGDWRRRDVIEFHAREKLLLLCHEPEGYTDLGRLVAKIAEIPRDEFVERYAARYMQALQVHASRGRHTNVLEHMVGYLRDKLDQGDRAELADVIRDYRSGLVPLIVPITLIRHHVRRHRIGYLESQYYLQPHPKELMLRNHV